MKTPESAYKAAFEATCSREHAFILIFLFKKKNVKNHEGRRRLEALGGNLLLTSEESSARPEVFNSSYDVRVNAVALRFLSVYSCVPVLTYVTAAVRSRSVSLLVIETGDHLVVPCLPFCGELKSQEQEPLPWILLHLKRELSVCRTDWLTNNRNHR